MNNTISSLDYANLDRKPIVIYIIPQGSFFAGERVRIGNAALVPDDLIQHGRSIMLINAETGNKLYVKPDTSLEIE